MMPPSWVWSKGWLPRRTRWSKRIILPMKDLRLAVANALPQAQVEISPPKGERVEGGAFVGLRRGFLLSHQDWCCASHVELSLELSLSPWPWYFEALTIDHPKVNSIALSLEAFEPNDHALTLFDVMGCELMPNVFTSLHEKDLKLYNLHKATNDFSIFFLSFTFCYFTSYE